MATILITGASSGIGAAAAVELSRQGHHVVATGRSPSRLAEVYQQMREAARSVDGAVPSPIPADLSDLDEVRRLAATILSEHPSLDVLVNNAGLQPHHRRTTEEGHELTLAVNHLAPMLLSCLLADLLISRNGRIVTTSSSSHTKGSFDFDNLHLKKGWNPGLAYGRSKLANILFTVEVRRRIGLPASSFHPGVITTEINRESRWNNLFKPLEKIVMSSPRVGADTMIWLATEDEGAEPRSIYYYRRNPERISDPARDPDLAARLWEESARLIGVTV